MVDPNSAHDSSGLKGRLEEVEGGVVGVVTDITYNGGAAF